MAEADANGHDEAHDIASREEARDWARRAMARRGEAAAAEQAAGGGVEPGVTRSSTAIHETQADHGLITAGHGETRLVSPDTAVQVFHGDVPDGLSLEFVARLPATLKDTARATEHGKWLNRGGEIPRHATRLFKFARHVMGQPDLLAAGAVVAWQVLLRLVPDWMEALGVLRGGRTSAGYEDAEAVKDAWELIWDTVKAPEGNDSVEVALRQARQLSLDFSTVWPDVEPRKALAASALAWLQVSRGINPIYFPRRRWGAAFEVSAETASRISKHLLRRDLLRETEGGKYSFSKHQAVEYRFNLGLFPALQGVMDAEAYGRAIELFDKLPKHQGPQARATALQTVSQRSTMPRASEPARDSSDALPPESHEGDRRSRPGDAQPPADGPEESRDWRERVALTAERAG